MATRQAPKPKGVRTKVKVVSEPPARRSNQTTRYRDAMAEARKLGKGKWVEIATFDSPNGAAEARRGITNGDRLIDGRVSEWAVESRRLRDDAGELVGSALYVRLK